MKKNTITYFALLFLGPLGCIIFYFLHIDTPHLTWNGSLLIGILWWMLLWWVFELVPLAVTALLPIILMPIILGLPIKAVTAQYGNPIIFLFLGGFVLGLAIQKSNLSERIALFFMSLFGTSPKSLLIGFMIPTAFLSLWISNTATTIMMIPIALSVINSIKLPPNHPFKYRLILSIAYAATIGGAGTLIGTPPNAVLAAVAEQHNFHISFGEWMLVGIPMVIVMLAFAFFLLAFRIPKFKQNTSNNVIKTQYHNLGPMTHHERSVLIVFIGMAFLWIFGGLLSKWTHIPISSTVVAILGSIVLFLLPVNLNKKIFAIDWETVTKLPWSVLLLFGGGLTLAYAMQATHLNESIGYIFSLMHLSPAWLVIIIALFTLILTEFNSNTATSSAFIPIVFAIALSDHQNPLIYGSIVALASSFAFMLPMGTPPNNIVFGTKLITIKQMIRFGIFLNTGSIFIIFLLYEIIISHLWS